MLSHGQTLTRYYRFINCRRAINHYAIDGDFLTRTYQTVIDGAKANLENYTWQDIPSPEEVGKIRIQPCGNF